MNTTTPVQNSNQRAFDVRGQILDDAKQCVNKDRNAAHGNPEDNFTNIAVLWEAYLSIRPEGPIGPLDVAHMMNLMKMARLIHNPTHKDSWVDTAGYAACGGGIALAPKSSEESANIEGLQAAKAHADIQRAYTKGVQNAIDEHKTGGIAFPPPPMPSPTNHACGVFERPGCKGEYNNLLTYMARERRPVDTDYMYDEICEFLGTTKNRVLCVSAASLAHFRKLHIIRKRELGINNEVLTDHLNDICKRQGHTLYLY